MTPEQQALAESLVKELWEKFKDNNEPIGQAKFYYKDNREYWMLGCAAGIEAARANPKLIRDILDVYGEMAYNQGLQDGKEFARIDGGK